MPDTAVALVLAKGTSSRVPRKNARFLCGRPLVAWPVRAAVKSGLFGKVLISTDDASIAAAAIHEGAIWPFVRPESLADAYSTTAEVLRHDLARITQQTGKLPAWCCALYGTSVFVTPAMLKKAWEAVRSRKGALVFAVLRYAHPIERALQPAEDGVWRYRQPAFQDARTQDIPPSWHDAGLFYFFDAHAFMKNAGSFQGLVRVAIEVSPQEATDIDTEDDWQWAQTLAALRGLGRQA